MDSEQFKPDTLLMFSGGLDSTGAFWKLLKDGVKIHVHHMNLRNVERRAVAEKIAIRAIIQYMKEIGRFDYSESTHEYPVFNKQFIWDSDIISFIAGTMCLSMPWIKNVALGMTASDMNPSVQNRIERANKVLGAFSTNVEKIYPVLDLTKQQIYDMLPKELIDKTWSCRTPLYSNEGKPFPCNQCQTCTEMHKLK